MLGPFTLVLSILQGLSVRGASLAGWPKLLFMVAQGGSKTVKKESSQVFYDPSQKLYNVTIISITFYWVSGSQGLPIFKRRENRWEEWRRHICKRARGMAWTVVAIFRNHLPDRAFRKVNHTFHLPS